MELQRVTSFPTLAGGLRVWGGQGSLFSDSEVGVAEFWEE